MYEAPPPAKAMPSRRTNKPKEPSNVAVLGPRPPKGPPPASVYEVCLCMIALQPKLMCQECNFRALNPVQPCRALTSDHDTGHACRSQVWVVTSLLLAIYMHERLYMFFVSPCMMCLQAIRQKNLERQQQQQQQGIEISDDDPPGSSQQPQQQQQQSTPTSSSSQPQASAPAAAADEKSKSGVSLSMHARCTFKKKML